MTVNKRLNAEEIEAIRKRTEKLSKGNILRDMSVLALNNKVVLEDVPKLLAEIERLKAQLSELIGAVYEYEPEGTALWDLAEAIDNDED
jgi:uncharacterized small protein (DUF1192 family)